MTTGGLVCGWVKAGGSKEILISTEVSSTVALPQANQAPGALSSTPLHFSIPMWFTVHSYQPAQCQSPTISDVAGLAWPESPGLGQA